MNDTTNNTTIAPPSTPSWMTDQRNKRRNNRRRSSFGGRSTPGLRRSGSMPLSSTDNAHRESAALFAGTPSALDFDGEDHDVLDDNGTGEGGGEGIIVGDRNNGKRLVRRSTYTDGETTPTPDQGQGSAHSSRPPRSATSGTGSEYSKQSSKRMKRPNNIPRPPRSRGGSSKASSASTRSQISTPKVDDYLKDFEFGSEETLTSASSASSASESRDTPMKGVVINGGGKRRNATKRPKVMSTPRSSNNTATASSASAMLPPRAIAAEENFTPANLNSNDVSSSTPIRKSSRLEQKARLATNNSSSTSSLSSSMVNNANNNTNNEVTTTRSRVTRATSKKRSALERSLPEGGTKSESNFQQHSSSSFGNFPSRSNSSSNSNILTQNNNSSSGSESFSSLAQRETNWANTTTGGATITKLKGCDHKRSMSVASLSSTNNNGGGLLRSHSISNALKTPSTIHSRSISCGGNLSSWNINNLSPERCLGTNQSTPSTGASSSRKRRTMDDSSPILNDNDLLDGSERSRLRRTPPDELLGGSERSRPDMPPPPPPTQPFILEDAINELRCPPSNEPIQQPQQQIMNPFLLPPTSATFGTSLMNDDMMSLVGNDDFDLDHKKKPGMRDRLSSETEDMNDESMTMNESDNDNDNNSTTSISSEESEDDNKTPRELTNVEMFDTKSSYDDFKFLTKSLQAWSKKSLNGKGASMGLNNGCLIAMPADWTFEHRGSFAKWVATAFPSFRVGSVGGAGGSFLKCSDAEGKKALMKLIRILNDHKSGRLENVKAGSSAANKAKGAKPAARLPIRPSSRNVRSATLMKEEPIMSICESMDDGLLLAEEMKDITLEEKKPERRDSSSSWLQPFNPFKNGFRNLSPKLGDDRPPRPSSEQAIAPSDFMNQLHGISSPSPPRSRSFLGPGRRFRERASRVLHPGRRPSEEKPPRPSFESVPSPMPYQGGLKPFESPHPHNSFALQSPHPNNVNLGTPCMATPMPRQVENWGSRPIVGKDWGDSIMCCEAMIEACNSVFANSWFTSDFYNNKSVSNEYGMTFDKEDESSLLRFYQADDGADDDQTEVASNNDDVDSFDDDLDDFPALSSSRPKIAFQRCDSVGASALNLLHLDDRLSDFGQKLGQDRRKTMKLKKYARMSLCVAATSEFLRPKLKRCYRLSQTPTKKRPSLKGTPINKILDSTVFSHVLSYLNEKELLRSASLVSQRFADVAAEALGKLMLVSVGCGSPRGEETFDGSSPESSHSKKVEKSMERTWSYLMLQFPWAQFLSDGAFKKVYKVWNSKVRAYEALSVMNVNAISEMGNLNLVGTELAVSTILSSLARRHICPNFVVSRGVFTCQYEPPASLWGSKDDDAPRGLAFNDNSHALQRDEATPSQSGNFQYIRMELCENGDVEEFIKNQPNKILAPSDCQNLLFQMAFALHVAGDRYGLKHYDVKLLNFLLQSATETTIPDDNHPHVVLRYGVGAHIFRLRMHPSMANIAKLADYGTSIMRTDSDGQPISLGQFTTLENTPVDYLILGNAATQGYGHDCFGLGLCMLHLFTGHAPYEEILEDVVCPDNLKGKLRKVWKQKSHDVIHSVMLDNDESGEEVEDQTLFDTLYRFLVLFGIPDTDQQFGIQKVWRAINSTLLSTKRTRCKICPDTDIFLRDRKKFSLTDGTDERIANARRRLMKMDGAMELLLSLVSFDPKTRATPLDVINSRFMTDLIENNTTVYCEDDIVKSYTALST